MPTRDAASEVEDERCDEHADRVTTDRAERAGKVATMSEIQDVPVRLPVKLGQFLKLSGLVDSGAEASDLIASGDVDVDGELETRRGRQLHGGEIVTVTTDAWEARGRVVDASA